LDTVDWHSSLRAVEGLFSFGAHREGLSNRSNAEWVGEQMEQLNRRWREQDLPTAKMRVGIHTGPAVVGSLGSARRLKFTSVGDTVNTASRLESFDKEGFERDPSARSCRILIDESTLRLVEGLFEVEPVGHHELPGREGKVSIYRVLGRTGR